MKKGLGGNGIRGCGDVKFIFMVLMWKVNQMGKDEKFFLCFCLLVSKVGNVRCCQKMVSCLDSFILWVGYVIFVVIIVIGFKNVVYWCFQKKYFCYVVDIYLWC